MFLLDKLKQLGWHIKPHKIKKTKELVQFLIDNCICGMDCPSGKVGCCTSACKHLGSVGCELPREERPFDCISSMCSYAYRRLLNDKT